MVRILRLSDGDLGCHQLLDGIGPDTEKGEFGQEKSNLRHELNGNAARRPQLMLEEEPSVLKLN